MTRRSGSTLTSDDLSTTELDERTAAEKKPHRRVLSASTLTGDKVINAASEDLGKVDEIMIDIPTGRVGYAVLSFGGFLGMGDKLFAIPWDQLTVDEGRKCFVLNINRQTLENAPGFDKDNWPDMADRNWSTQVYSYYGSRPYWE